MFESDDYDLILSQLDFPEIPRSTNTGLKQPEKGNLDVKKTSLSTKNEINDQDTKLSTKLQNSPTSNKNENLIHKNISFGPPNSFSSPLLKAPESVNNNCNSNGILNSLNKISPKHSKRKIIDSHFDHINKRKFPGPAGLLTGRLEENKDESICHFELFSQDIDFSQNGSKRTLFDLPMWRKLTDNIVKWNLNEVDTIKGIKQQAVAGNLRRRKAQTVTAFVETVDRSATDPLIVLRDATGNIKCTLHRDAWSLFSPYLVAEHCALILWKPTVLTTGSAFKKHYLNITLNNIYAIFSSIILQDESEVSIPDGFVKDCENDFTIIKLVESPETLGNNETITNEQNLMDDLDSIFSDDIF